MSQDPPPRTALLLIDIQSGFCSSKWGPSRSNSSFEDNASLLLKTYRSLVDSTKAAGDSPHKIIHIAHSSLLSGSPLHPSAPGFDFQPFAAPEDGETVITKNVNSAFIGTNLEEVLRAHFRNGRGTLFVAGLTTDHCVSTTTRMAGNLWVCDAKNEDGSRGDQGEVIVVQDATAAWQKSEDGFPAEVVHKVNIESLEEFATIKDTEDAVKLLRGIIN